MKVLKRPNSVFLQGDVRSSVLKTLKTKKTRETKTRISQNFPIQEKSVCVCIVLVHYGPFPQEINEKSVKLAVSAVSLYFLHDFTLFVVDIHQIRQISLFWHFPDHFHFHGSAGLIPKVNLSLRPRPFQGRLMIQ